MKLKKNINSKIFINKRWFMKHCEINQILFLLAINVITLSSNSYFFPVNGKVKCFRYPLRSLSVTPLKSDSIIAAYTLLMRGFVSSSSFLTSFFDSFFDLPFLTGFYYSSS